jgi:hypothetical protein
MFCVDTYMDGFVCPPTRTGEDLKQYAWWDETWKRRSRAGMMNILDDKSRLAGAAMIARSFHEDGDPGELRIGTAVEVLFDDVTGDFTLPAFRFAAN